MDREYLIKSNLMEAHKQFMRLCNEGYLSTSLEEANDEEMPQDPTQQPQGDTPEDNNMPAMGPDNNQQPPIGGDMMPQDGNNINNDGQAPEPPIGDGAEIPPMDNNMPPMGPDVDEPQEEDDVLDVEDLTQAQEKLNKKTNMVGKDLGQLDGRIASLLSAVESMKDMINNQNNQITTLKAELEKRVPTQTERLNMRSLDSYPFNVNPKDYWKDKENQGVYQAEYNNGQQPENKEKVITVDDVNDYNESDIAQSLDDNLRQTMKDIFKGF